jgi:hypothetical protein
LANRRNFLPLTLSYERQARSGRGTRRIEMSDRSRPFHTWERTLVAHMCHPLGGTGDSLPRPIVGGR